MSPARETQAGGRRPPGRGDPGYEEYIPDYIPRLRPLKRLAPFSEMSCVFLMRDQHLGEDVILKMPAGLGMAQPKQIAWIEREIEALQSLHHAYAPQLLDCGIDDYGLPWFTLRFIQGPTLDRFIAGRHTVDRALRLAVELCEVVAAVHDAGLVHRDIKPENVMIEQDGHVRLIDFGIAGVPGEGAVTGDGRPVGTRPYMPREQGTAHESPATDVYSLGLVLCELVTGVRLPAPRPERSEEDEAKSLRAHVWSRLRRGLSRPLLARIIQRCTESDPEKRFTDGRELERALRRYIGLRRLRGVWTGLAAIAALLALLSLFGLDPW